MGAHGKLSTTLLAGSVVMDRRKGFRLPYSIDFTTLPDGALPAPWTGDTWAISGGAAVNTPTLGSELLNDTGLENWTSATDLTSYDEVVAGTSTINQEAVVVHGGSKSGRMDVDGSNSNAQIRQNTVAAKDSWILFTHWLRASASGKTGIFIATNMAGYVDVPVRNPSTEWTQYANSAWASAANPALGVRRSTASNGSLYWDDFSAKVISKPSMIATLPTARTDVDVSITIPALMFGTQAGIDLNIDDIDDPKYFVRVFHDGTYVRMVTCVNGVYTELFKAVSAWSAAHVLRAVKNGDVFQAYYNGVQVGTDQTVDGMTGTRHGIFSTYSGNSIKTVLIHPT